MSINLEQLKRTQQPLAKKVTLAGTFCQSAKFIGETDVGFEADGYVTRAAIVVLTYPDFKVVECHIARIKTQFPYIPSYLSFREYPALIEAWQQVTQKTDLLFVDGQGVAHPRV
ncbi:endonuclease V [Gilliamella sp. Pas-s25]|uniref:endonuclease V n=1 Tax=Gilliamella sp. Pas-s25 TaxID=2687310 RepID=UPI00135E7801|nr:endonuclease V [Gilliamella sp. Pas-s25]MWP63002.1 hypothetical protein [Gilliamella sp. Pas-s25]